MDKKTQGMSLELELVKAEEYSAIHIRGLGLRSDAAGWIGLTKRPDRGLPSRHIGQEHSDYQFEGTPFTISHIERTEGAGEKFSINSRN